MCLGIPGKVVKTYEEHDVLMGKVDFGGVFKRVCLEHVPQTQVGDYVIVHELLHFSVPHHGKLWKCERISGILRRARRVRYWFFF